MHFKQVQQSSLCFVLRCGSTFQSSGEFPKCTLKHPVVCNESKADGGGETGSGRQGHRQILIKAATLGWFTAIRTCSLNPGQMLVIGVDLAYSTYFIWIYQRLYEKKMMSVKPPSFTCKSFELLSRVFPSRELCRATQTMSVALDGSLVNPNTPLNIRALFLLPVVTFSYGFCDNKQFCAILDKFITSSDSVQVPHGLACVFSGDGVTEEEGFPQFDMWECSWAAFHFVWDILDPSLGCHLLHGPPIIKC